MLRFIIMGGLPYLYVEGKAYKCRFDENGFTPTAEEVEITEEPVRTYREIEIKAQCACLDSIGGAADEQVTDEAPVDEEETADEQVTDEAPVDEAAEPLTEMTLEELKEHAKEHDIKLGSARTKAEIIEKINATE